MLFVFGYRASKIRANKLSVLMHKSDSLGGVSRCSVAIHFAQIIDKVRKQSVLKTVHPAFKNNYYSKSGDKHVNLTYLRPKLKSAEVYLIQCI